MDARGPDRDARSVVAAGYDDLGPRYLDWSSRIEGDPRERFLTAFMDRLPSRATVLDLGCGPGVPSTQVLAESFEVVGVDVSMTQLRAARGHVPDAALVRADLADVAFREASFDGVMALYSLDHVPRGRHGDVLRSIHRWLRPGGMVLLSLGAGDDPGGIDGWLGVEMFFSGYDADTNRELVTGTGFDLLIDEVVTMTEPQGEATFLWLLARRR